MFYIVKGKRKEKSPVISIQFKPYANEMVVFFNNFADKGTEMTVFSTIFFL